jgi:hypothetical protein
MDGRMEAQTDIGTERQREGDSFGDYTVTSRGFARDL